MNVWTATLLPGAQVTEDDQWVVDTNQQVLEVIEQADNGTITVVPVGLNAEALRWAEGREPSVQSDFDPVSE